MTQPQPGDVYHFPDYVFPDGSSRDKFIVLLAVTRASDWIVVRTTSRQNGRPTHPPCYHGYPYPGYFVELADGLFRLPTWIALDRFDALDSKAFAARAKSRHVELKGRLGRSLFAGLLRCCVQSDDVTVLQDQAMREVLATLG